MFLSMDLILISSYTLMSSKIKKISFWTSSRMYSSCLEAEKLEKVFTNLLDMY